MALRNNGFLLLLLLCAAQAIGLQPFRTKDEVDPRSRRIRSSADTLQVNFTLRRVLISPEDDLCSVGMDRPGNITLEVFYLVRETAATSDWKHFQTITSGIDLRTYITAKKHA